MQRPKVITIVILLIAAFYLLQAGYHGAVWMGEKWFNQNAMDTWWMNPSLPFTAQHAYQFFAITAFAFAGALFGAGIIGIYKLVISIYNRCDCGLSRTKLIVFIALLATAFISGGVFMALGFNTFDWMVSYVTGTGGHPNTCTLWNFNLPFISIDAWNFYAYCMLAPLWIGGCLLAGIASFVLLCHDEL